MAHDIKIALTPPQDAFVFSEAAFPAFVGGFGAGKSEALVTRLLIKKLKHPQQDVGYFAPTFDLVRLIGMARFEEKLEQWRLPYKLNKTDRQLHLEGGGSVIFRSLETPERIVGFEIADAGIDELDTLKPVHAAAAWNKVIARCRQPKDAGAINSCAVATTPEGFRFVYQRWEKQRSRDYAIYRAPTYSNPYLPADYVQSLRDSFPANLLDAYVEGRFVNLTCGSVYPEFCRNKNHSDEAIHANEDLHIGVDFNVMNCTAIVCVLRFGKPHAVAELTGVRDTPALVAALSVRYAHHRVHIYPDASGRSHKSVNASLSDLQLLKNAGFIVHAKDANPPVRERVLTLNTLLHNAQGERHLHINTRACPILTECLEQQVYDKNGDPDKSADRDHAPDALGYFVVWQWPLVKPTVATPMHLPFLNR